MSNILKFKHIIGYFKSMGEVGFNIDMEKTHVSYSVDTVYTKDRKSRSIPSSITKLIDDLINQYGVELYNSTNKDDDHYMVGVTILPNENKMVLKPKYWDVGDDNYDINFIWFDNFDTIDISGIHQIFDKFGYDGEFTISWETAHEDFNIVECRLNIGDKSRSLKFTNDNKFKFHIKNIITKILGNVYWKSNSATGSLKFDGDGTGTLKITIEKNFIAIGKDLVVNDETFNKENITEHKMKLTENTDNTIFNGYINILEPYDSNPKNLNISEIQYNTRFSKLLNTILYELYSDNLGMNDDNSKYGIIDIYPLNEFTSWSILNYFGGHKFVKQRLIDQFNRTSNEKTPKEFYRWLIENKEVLLKTGPIIKDLIRTNFNTYNKGSATEKYVIDKLGSLGYDVKYYPPGSKKDREGGIDIEVNGVSYQTKELIGIEEKDGKIYLKTPLPKNYLGLEVKRIMLVNINTGEFVSFPNKNYKLDLQNNAFIVNSVDRSMIKSGNFNKI